MKPRRPAETGSSFSRDKPLPARPRLQACSGTAELLGVKIGPARAHGFGRLHRFLEVFGHLELDRLARGNGHRLPRVGIAPQTGRGFRHGQRRCPAGSPTYLQANCRRTYRITTSITRSASTGLTSRAFAMCWTRSFLVDLEAIRSSTFCLESLGRERVFLSLFL